MSFDMSFYFETLSLVLKSEQIERYPLSWAHSYKLSFVYECDRDSKQTFGLVLTTFVTDKFWQQNLG